MTAVADARTRLPREAYPGLRPFLAFEAALIFGRERQVREVIERLQATQFVAVLGGPGSGKSSLIHAGVVPELFSFGIPGAGDLWLPLTCTPGNNVAVADSLARRHSPITRLARRFAALLKSRGHAQADQQRLQQIADVARQEACFARLLDTFGAELDVPPTLAAAIRLDAWLIAEARITGATRVPVTRIYQYGPRCARDGRDLRAALAIMNERGRARMEVDGRRRYVVVNPSLLIEDS